MIKVFPPIEGTPHNRASAVHQWISRYMLGLGTVLLVWALIACFRIREGLALAHVHQAAERDHADSFHVDSGASTGTSNDFTQHLPRIITPEQLMAVFERAQLDHGVSLERVQLAPRPGEPGQLRTVDLSLSLKATYPALKAMLADITARCPELTLVRMNLQHGTGEAQTEAQVVLRAWARASKSESPASMSAVTASR